MESKINFSEVVNRRGTNSVKWDKKEEIFGEDVLPLWVADMDFKAPKKVIEKISEKVQGGILGYTYMKEEDYSPFVKFVDKRHHLNINKGEIVNVPGVVPGIAMAILSNTNEGDSILIQTPVYPPFKEVIEKNNRNVVTSSLLNKGGVYCIDFIDLEKKIIENDVKMMIICNPHNPVGRVWMWEELSLLVDICKKHNVIILSDEMHSDIIYYGHHFTSILHLRDVYDNIMATFSPSKTFNLPSLYFAMLISPRKEIRDNMVEYMERLHINPINAVNAVGAMAAYEYGDEWLNELLTYLHDNISFVIKFIKENMKDIKVIRPQGTYLLWLDFTKVFQTHEKLNDFLVKEAKLGLSPGINFGEEGEGFARLNVACPRETLEIALNRMLDAYNKIK